VKPVLIVNPRSGGGKTGKIWAEMRPAIARAVGEAEVLMTERTGHAIELAEQAASTGAPLVIAVGGDGTFNEVVGGVMRSKRDARVGLIGQGTGGDFRKTLGIEHRLDRYLDAIASGNERSLDVGLLSYRKEGEATAQERHFVNITSAGMGGLVDKYVASASRAAGGKAAYFGASLKALVNAARGNVVCEVTHEGATREVRLTSIMIAVCNGQYFGSGMHVAPMAKPDDGVFEVVSMDAPSKLGFALRSSKIYRGDHLADQTTTHFPCSKITLTLANPDVADRFLLDVDGEPLGRLPATMTCLPKALFLRA
jgi:YegS/Rv2252/BmrU family lipid kinase